MLVVCVGRVAISYWLAGKAKPPTRTGWGLRDRLGSILARVVYGNHYPSTVGANKYKRFSIHLNQLKTINDYRHTLRLPQVPVMRQNFNCFFVAVALKHVSSTVYRDC